jgi:primosomal protein N' (replication factor Y)
LRCHHCGSERRIDTECGSCGDEDLRNLGYGTERLEAVLNTLFADVPIVRIDRDSVRNKGALEAHLDRVHESDACVLVGTQMLAKGHHFERVTLVGVLDADRGLFSNDFRATERMAQLLVQVSGRAGRAHLPGQVVLQSYQPEHPLLRLLLQEGYPAFAEEALAERHAAGLPPATAWALLRAESTDQLAAIAFLEQAQTEAGSPANVELWGPIPAPMERQAGRYRHQLLVRAPKRAPLQRFLRVWVPKLEALKVSRKVRWSLDVDPIETL